MHVVTVWDTYNFLRNRRAPMTMATTPNKPPNNAPIINGTLSPLCLLVSPPEPPAIVLDDGGNEDLSDWNGNSFVDRNI